MKISTLIITAAILAQLSFNIWAVGKFAEVWEYLNGKARR